MKCLLADSDNDDVVDVDDVAVLAAEDVDVLHDVDVVDVHVHQAAATPATAAEEAAHDFACREVVRRLALKFIVGKCHFLSGSPSGISVGDNPPFQNGPGEQRNKRPRGCKQITKRNHARGTNT